MKRPIVFAVAVFLAFVVPALAQGPGSAAPRPQAGVAVPRPMGVPRVPLAPPGVNPQPQVPVQLVVTARQALPSELPYRSVPSPMLLDIPLQADLGHKSLRDLDGRNPTVITETNAFACNGVRVTSIRIDKVSTPEWVSVGIVSEIESERPGRTIDLTTSLSIGRYVVDSSTQRLFTGGPENPSQPGTFLPVPGSFGFAMRPAEFQRFFSTGETPVLRLIVDVP